MAKLPSFQFYPGDWKKDAGVQALSYEERGIWFELMLMMFESPERGKLIFRTGTPIPEDAVARALGLDKQKVNQNPKQTSRIWGCVERGGDGNHLLQTYGSGRGTLQKARGGGQNGRKPEFA